MSQRLFCLVPVLVFGEFSLALVGVSRLSFLLAEIHLSITSYDGSFGQIHLARSASKEGDTGTDPFLRDLVILQLFADGNVNFWGASSPVDRVLSPGSLRTLHSLPLVGRGWQLTTLLLYSRWYCCKWTTVKIQDPASGEEETLHLRRRFLSCVLHSNQPDSRRSHGLISEVNEDQADDRVLIDVHREYLEYSVNRLLEDPRLFYQSHPEVSTILRCPSDLQFQPWFERNTWDTECVYLPQDHFRKTDILRQSLTNVNSSFFCRSIKYSGFRVMPSLQTFNNYERTEFDLFQIWKRQHLEDIDQILCFWRNTVLRAADNRSLPPDQLDAILIRFYIYLEDLHVILDDVARLTASPPQSPLYLSEIRHLVLESLFADDNIKFWSPTTPMDRELLPGALALLHSLPLVGTEWPLATMLLYRRWYACQWVEVEFQDSAGVWHEERTLRFQRRYLRYVLHSNQHNSRRSWGLIPVADMLEQAADQVLIDVHREYIEYSAAYLLENQYLCWKPHLDYFNLDPDPPDPRSQSWFQGDTYDPECVFLPPDCRRKTDILCWSLVAENSSFYNRPVKYSAFRVMPNLETLNNYEKTELRLFQIWKKYHPEDVAENLRCLDYYRSDYVIPEDQLDTILIRAFVHSESLPGILSDMARLAVVSLT